MSELLALADRCEKATEADRELDQRIFAAVNGWSYPLVGAAFHSFNDKPHEFTGSIADARPLIPEGFAWTLSTIGMGPFRYWASVGFPDEEAASYTATAATPELALSAAAIRARAAEVRG